VRILKEPLERSTFRLGVVLSIVLVHGAFSYCYADSSPIFLQSLGLSDLPLHRPLSQSEIAKTLASPLPSESRVRCVNSSNSELRDWYIDCASFASRTQRSCSPAPGKRSDLAITEATITCRSILEAESFFNPAKLNTDNATSPGQVILKVENLSRNFGLLIERFSPWSPRTLLRQKFPPMKDSLDAYVTERHGVLKVRSKRADDAVLEWEYQAPPDPGTVCAITPLAISSPDRRSGHLKIIARAEASSSTGTFSECAWLLLDQDLAGKVHLQSLQWVGRCG
jgi:hypothetical protein